MLDQVLIPIGGFACARLQTLSAYLAHRSGRQTPDGAWSIGLTLLGLCGGSLVAVMLWRERRSQAEAL
jgi:hypothetical protein